MAGPEDRGALRATTTIQIVYTPRFLTTAANAWTFDASLEPLASASNWVATARSVD